MTTKDDCLDALREAAEQLGESPSRGQYEDLGFTPAHSTILRHCGGWNAAKEEAGLETNASTGSRTLPKPDDVELPEGLVWEELSQDQRWHYRNREWNTERSRRRRANIREWLNEQKAESGCSQCGMSDPAALDFHHRYDEQKELSISKAVTFGWSKEAIRSEVAKCDLLCANCHSIEHHSQQVWMDSVADEIVEGEFDLSVEERDALLSAKTTHLHKAERLRLWTHSYKREQHCRTCGYSNPVALQFHHTDSNKTSEVGALISNSAPTSAVVEEVGKCVVLCANCHRLEHAVDPTERRSVDTE